MKRVKERKGHRYELCGLSASKRALPAWGCVVSGLTSLTPMTSAR